MSRNRLYLTMGSLLMASYAYALWSLSHRHINIVLCPIKNITGIACPSCGTTRSVTALLQGHFQEAAFINPLGYFAALIMLALPFWLLYDLFLKKDTFYKGYNAAENFIKGNKIIIIFAATLMITNWIWNIYKGL